MSGATRLRACEVTRHNRTG